MSDIDATVNVEVKKCKMKRWGVTMYNKAIK